MNSDPHNYGKKVTRAGDKVLKPRNCFFEYLFLGRNSQLREKINNIFFEICPAHELLPGLDFFTKISKAPTLKETEIQWLNTTPLTQQLTPAQLTQIGAKISLINWMGLVDSHSQNLIIGLQDQNFIFTNLDWETSFSTIDSAYDSALFKCKIPIDGHNVTWADYGLSLLVQNKAFFPKKDLAYILQGHLLMREKLILEEKNLSRILAEEQQGRALVRRVILRPTSLYQKCLRSQDFSSFLEEEVVQLKRGDIPYFFQVDRDESIYYWTGEEDFQAISGKETIPRFPSRKEFSYSKELFDEVTLCIARDIDFFPGEIFESQTNDITLMYKKKSIAVIFKESILTVGRRE